MEGAEEESFRAIVASGPRSAMPHAVPTGARIGKDDPVVIDLGARRNGYCSDETVTILPPRRFFQRARFRRSSGVVHPPADRRAALDRAGRGFAEKTGALTMRPANVLHLGLKELFSLFV